MKFNTTTILGLAYVMMLMGAHVLAIREKVSFERSSRHRRIRKGRKGRKAHSKTKVVCPAEASNFNYYNFFKALTLTAIGTTTGDMVREVNELINPNLEKECGIEMNNLHKSEVTKRINTIEKIRDECNQKIKDLTNKVKYVNTAPITQNDEKSNKKTH